MNMVESFLNDFFIFLEKKTNLTYSNDITFILNPKSVLLKNKRKLKKVFLFLKSEIATFKKQDNFKFFISKNKEDLINISKRLFLELNLLNKKNLIITFGGDGTHHIVVDSILKESKHKTLFKNISFLFAPLGTGNDVAITDNFIKFLKMIKRPSIEKPLKVVEIDIDNKEKYYSNNIVSIGIDAYINILKTKYKKISYSLLSFISLFTYDFRYKIPLLKVSITKNNNNNFVYGKFITVVFGKEGYRTYGGSIPILPFEQNFCTFENCSILERILFKFILDKKEHPYLSKVLLKDADSISFKMKNSGPMQIDGENFILKKNQCITFKNKTTEFKVIDFEKNTE